MRRLRDIALALLLTPALLAQTPSPNADILKMIQAGLPESVIVNKIKANQSSLDTSTDALIALQKAGATEAELAAMTAPLPPSAAAVAPPAPIYIAGGLLLHTREGDPYLKFPESMSSVFANGEQSNTAKLVVIEGKVAVSVPTDYWGPGPSAQGNLVISHDTLLYSPTLLNAGYSYPKKGKYVWGEKELKFAKTDVVLMPLNQVVVTLGRADNIPAMYFVGKNRAFMVGWHRTYDSDFLCVQTNNCSYPSAELLSFVVDLIHHFDETIAPFLHAANIADPEQLSPQAHFHPATAEDYPKYAAVYQAQLDHTPPPASGGFWNGFSEVMQVASAGATAIQQGNAGGNTPAAQAAARAQYDQTVASIESGNASSPAPYIPPATPTATPQAQPTPAASSGKTYTKVYNLPIAGGGNQKETIVTTPSGSTITVECFAPHGISPYDSYTRSGPSPFFSGLPPCPTAATATNPTTNTTSNAAPPVPYRPTTSPNQGAIVPTLCPASGFVPGAMKQSGDTAVGIQCTPGQPISANPNAKTPTITSSGTTAPGDFVAGMDWCTKESFTPLAGGVNTDNYLTFYDGCAQPIYIMWVVGSNGTPAGRSFAAGEQFNQTGLTQTNVHNQGGVTYYACPADHPVAVTPQGGQIFGPVTQYMCARRS